MAAAAQTSSIDVRKASDCTLRNMPITLTAYRASPSAVKTGAETERSPIRYSPFYTA